MLPAEEKVIVCRKCRLPARLRDLHFLGLARREGREELKQHIIRELGKDNFDRLGGDYHGVMDWIGGILRFEAWEKHTPDKNGREATNG